MTRTSDYGFQKSGLHPVDYRNVKVPPTIFREYDLRGIAGQDLTPGVAERIGRSVSTYLHRQGRHRIALGRDCRLSSGVLRDGLAEGLLAGGLEVHDIGICPTPLLYYAIRHLELEGGIMITGSHNPPDYNGFKVAAGDQTIHGEQIQELRRILDNGDLAEGKGTVVLRDVQADYLSELAAKFSLSRKLKVVVDCGNGTGSLTNPSLLERIGCQVTRLYCEMDGNFPNHHPDPTVPVNLHDLIRAVRETGADVGVAYDGDADRIGVVDDAGAVLWGDQLLILYAREILRNRPGASIIGEVKCSKNLFADIRRHGGNAIMWKAGHSLIKAKMKEVHAAVAGEMSGHMFFADEYYGFDDALYATCRLLRILDSSDIPLSRMLDDLPKTYSTPEIRVDCPDSKKFEVVEKAKTHFSSLYNTVTVDGVRIELEDGWGLVRASNTQPVLVLRFEADSEVRLGEIRNLVESAIRQWT
jgi:phosphomannomutase/phosphoglucomutase